MNYEDETTVVRQPDFVAQHQRRHVGQPLPPAPLRPVEALPTANNGPTIVVTQPVTRTGPLTKVLLTLLTLAVSICTMGVWQLATRQMPNNTSTLQANRSKPQAYRQQPAQSKPKPGPKTASQPDEHPARVDTINLNLREYASRDAPVVTVLPEDTEVTMLDETQEVDSQLWVKIRLGDASGWVNRKYLMPL